MEKIVRFSLAVSLLFVAVPLASAQSRDEQAKAHFKAGTELYDQSNLRGALAEFQRAYELFPSYKLLFNIGQVSMELRDYAAAMRAYTRYLREGGSDVAAARATMVEGELDKLRGRVGHIAVQTTAGAEVVIDAVAVGYAPLPEPVVVNSGRHEVSVHVAGRDPIVRSVDVAGQQEVTVAIGNDLAVRAEAPRDRDRPAKPPSKKPMYIAWSVTGALALTAGVAAGLTYSRSNDLSDLRHTFPITQAQLDDAAGKVSTSSAIADGFTAAALVAGGVSLYLTLSRPTAEHPREKRVELRVSPTGAFVAGQF